MKAELKQLSTQHSPLIIRLRRFSGDLRIEDAEKMVGRCRHKLGIEIEVL